MRQESRDLGAPGIDDTVNTYDVRWTMPMTGARRGLEWSDTGTAKAGGSWCAPYWT